MLPISAHHRHIDAGALGVRVPCDSDQSADREEAEENQGKQRCH